VLLPSRAADVPIFDAPPEHLGRQGHPLTCVFAGTINSPSYARALQALADALLPLQGRLLLFGPLTPEQAAAAGIQAKNVEIRGLLGSAELIQKCRDEADVLFVPMSFSEVDRPNMQVSFPSKLADYTAMGLPLLIHGPDYSSAVRWARENPGVAEVVDTDDMKRLLDAVKRLAGSPEHRTKLAVAALAAGDRFFSNARAQATFHRALENSAVSTVDLQDEAR
jgi:hypothetical protein